MARLKGSTNLKRVDGGYINQHGVFFTEDEKRSLESAVNTAMSKRRRMLKEASQLDRMADGKPTGDKLLSLQAYGSESDFILAKKSKSLQRFKSKAEYENYLDNVRQVNDRGYIDRRTEQYRENYFTALRRAFDSDADDIIAKLESMTLKEYRQWVEQNDDVLEIGYIYLRSGRYQKLNEIRRALLIDEVEAPEDDEILDMKRMKKKRKKKG